MINLCDHQLLQPKVPNSISLNSLPLFTLKYVDEDNNDVIRYTPDIDVRDLITIEVATRGHYDKSIRLSFSFLSICICFAECYGINESRS